MDSNSEIITGIRLLNSHQLSCFGEWTAANVPMLEDYLQHFHSLRAKEIDIDGSEITTMDTVGALILNEFIVWMDDRQVKVNLINFSKEHLALLKLVNTEKKVFKKEPKLPSKPSVFERIGRETVAKYQQINNYLAFFGQFVVTSLHSIFHFKSIELRSFFNAVEEMGYNGLPIVGLLSFLVGVVLAYQLGTQLENYGANAYIVNLIGIAILREFGPLITAIIGAGRTTSAITAQIGTMKINEELDALQTMGISPVELLVVPKILASLIAFPLLVIWANITGILGGMLMTKYLYNMNYTDFLMRLRDAVDVTTFMVGWWKAPTFGLIISMVGCFQGMNVALDADSIGKQTTKSVVQAIFLIIVADTIYSVIYSHLNI